MAPSWLTDPVGAPPKKGPQAPPHADLFDFLDTAVAWHRPLQTYRWLARAGIRPSNATARSLAHLQRALAAGFGRVPYLGCVGPRYNETIAGAGSRDAGRTRLAEVWYHFHARGRPQAAAAADPRVHKRLAAREAARDGAVSNCARAAGAVWYHERTSGSEQ